VGEATADWDDDICIERKALVSRTILAPGHHSAHHCDHVAPSVSQEDRRCYALLRHTFAAWAVHGGVTVPELMALGALKSHSMALRYSHLLPDHLAQAAERVAGKSVTTSASTGDG
jgi:hypothetical protein